MVLSIAKLAELKSEASFSKTREFLVAAESAGVFETYLELANNPQTSSRNLRILTLYANSEVTLADIGLLFGSWQKSQSGAQFKPLSRERIRQINESTLGGVQKISPNSLIMDFPPTELSLRKPRSRLTRMRYSSAHGGISAKVADLLTKGLQPPQIIAETGITSNSYNGVRSRLRKSGIDAPYLNEDYNKLIELKGQLTDPDLTPEQKEKIFETMKYSHFRALAHKRSDLLIMVSRVAKAAGLHRLPNKLPLALQILTECGILYGSAVNPHEDRRGRRKNPTYHFIAALDYDRAKKALAETDNIELLSPPVTQIAGSPAEQLPTSTELVFTNRYISFRQLATRCKVAVGRTGITIAELLTESDKLGLRWFKYRNGHYLAEDQLPLVKTFISRTS